MASTLTDYERRRLENIKRNDEMMAALKLQQKSQQLSTASKRPRTDIKSYKSTPEKKPKSRSPIVIRRSLRTKGIPPDAASAKGLEDDLSSSPPSTKSAPYLSPSVQKSCSLSTRKAYVGQGSDHQLFDIISSMMENEPLCRRKKRADFGRFDLESLDLKPENVARLVPGRIFTVGFFPSEERTVVFAGDKLGHVGFWDVDCAEKEGNGVYLFCPHSAPVSGIVVRPFFLSKIFTSSYDGFIRLMDVEAATFNMVFSSQDAIFSVSQRPQDFNSLFFGEGQGKLKIWDQRSKNVVSSHMLHAQRINSVDFNIENTNLMATSSTDATACIWDLRSVSAHRPKCIQKVNHKRAVHSAYFSPSGSCLATTSLDNKLGLLSGVNFEDIIMIDHNNQTSRWISSFRAVWGWDDSYLFIGNTRRAVDAISTANKTTTSLESSCMTAIPCRFAVQPFKVGTLAGATGGGQVYMWTR